MTSYNATITLAERLDQLTDERTDAIIDALADHHPAITRSAAGDAMVTITIPADSLRQAIATAQALLAELQPIGLEVLPTDVWDRLVDLIPTLELLSVTEAAERLGVTRQAVLQRIESGSLQAKLVGRTWIVPASTLGTDADRAQGVIRESVTAGAGVVDPAGIR